MYWYADFDPVVFASTTGGAQFITVSVHSFNLILVTVDLLWGRFVFAKQHWWIIICSACSYGLLNIVYVKASGDIIYKVLPWDSSQYFVVTLLNKTGLTCCFCT